MYIKGGEGFLNLGFEPMKFEPYVWKSSSKRAQSRKEKPEIIEKSKIKVA